MGDKKMETMAQRATWECQDCGAVVHNPYTHRQWHTRTTVDTDPATPLVDHWEEQFRVPVRSSGAWDDLLYSAVTWATLTMRRKEMTSDYYRSNLVETAARIRAMSPAEDTTWKRPTASPSPAVREKLRQVIRLLLDADHAHATGQVQMLEHNLQGAEAILHGLWLAAGEED
jgi:hypothetical protein